MKIRFKNLGNATLPSYAKPGDGGMDIVATKKWYDEFGNVCYGTDLAMEIPEGYVCLIFPRSSNSKKDLILSNGIGVLDSGFRGELTFKFKPSPVYSEIGEWGWNSIWLKESHHQDYEIGDRIGQIIILPYPTIEPEWADELTETERGTNGWGSSGN